MINCEKEDLKKALELYNEIKGEQKFDNEMIITILEAKNRVSSRDISESELKDDDIFVFGSNEQGVHKWRASAFAAVLGAEQGKGEGLSGRTYAFPVTRIKEGKLPADWKKKNSEDLKKEIGEENFVPYTEEEYRESVNNFIKPISVISAKTL